MVQIVCPCLNVRVHGKGSTLQLRDAGSLNLSESALGDDFFSSPVYEVLLDLGGVTKAQKSLCTSRSVDGWVITSCSGCDLDVYAKHVDDNDHVLVSSTMEGDLNKITSLIESENYSPLFKLLLPEVNDNFIQNNFGSDFESSHGGLEQAIQSIHQQVSTYLREEQKAMDERIRQFTELQHMKYAALQQKLRKNKQSMMYLLLKVNRKSSLCEPMIESPSPLSSPLSPSHNSSDESSSSTDSALPLSENTEPPVEKKVQSHVRALRRHHSVNTPTRSRAQEFKKGKNMAHSIDVGDVFEMEGFDNPIETETAPFDNTDDDSDGSSAGEESGIALKEEESHSVFATSLPVSVPSWPHYHQFPDLEEFDRVAHHEDPDQMAASFRAIAQSVCDGTEMFGDLPRRRLNTGDLIKSRPI